MKNCLMLALFWGNQHKVDFDASERPAACQKQEQSLGVSRGCLKFFRATVEGTGPIVPRNLGGVLSPLSYPTPNKHILAALFNF